jgi:hypothetical protein
VKAIERCHEPGSVVEIGPAADEDAGPALAVGGEDGGHETPSLATDISASSGESVLFTKDLMNIL